MSIHIKHHSSDRAATRESDIRRMNLVLRWWQGAVQDWQRRKMTAALESLDDRTLLDIGIHRGDIKRVVDGFTDAELRMVPPAPKPHDFSHADLRRAG